ncbi:MAG: hypothetical protein HIU91_09230 [Acidobacteria bacterium]|nr:hypothetical protein [Acidobacteriota bacterium]
MPREVVATDEWLGDFASTKAASTASSQQVSENTVFRAGRLEAERLGFFIGLNIDPFVDRP